jgi:hypothetical protein
MTTSKELLVEELESKLDSISYRGNPFINMDIGKNHYIIQYEEDCTFYIPLNEFIMTFK